MTVALTAMFSPTPVPKVVPPPSHSTLFTFKFEALVAVPETVLGGITSPPPGPPFNEFL